MLKDILSVSGKPGLFKLLSTNRNNFVVESLVDRRRMPIHAHDRVVSLKEISVYTKQGDIPLGEVFDKMYKKNDGKTIDIESLGKEKDVYFAFFEDVLPDYDKQMVHANEIKKMIIWYNLLIANGFTAFANKPEAEESNDVKTTDGSSL